MLKPSITFLPENRAKIIVLVQLSQNTYRNRRPFTYMAFKMLLDIPTSVVVYCRTSLTKAQGVSGVHIIFF